MTDAEILQDIVSFAPGLVSINDKTKPEECQNLIGMYEAMRQNLKNLDIIYLLIKSE